MVKYTFGNDSSLSNKDFDIKSFQTKINKYRPKILAFNGKKPAKIFLGNKDLVFGLYKEKKIDDANIFILPSTSGAANKSWVIRYWEEIAEMIKGCKF